MEKWGFKGDSGNGMKIIAALGYYGLLDDQGSAEKRKVRLTEAAERILLDHKGSKVRQEAVAEAALSPRIYNELWKDWEGQLPPYEEMRSHLIFEKKFNEKVVSDVIADYKATLSFAGLLDYDASDEEKQAVKEDAMTTEEHLVSAVPHRARMNLPPGTKPIEIPITTTPWPILTVEFPMSEDKWSQMMAMLAAMKPAIVEANDENEGDE